MGPTFIISDNRALQRSLERSFRYGYGRDIHQIYPGFREGNETSPLTFFNHISTSITRVIDQSGGIETSVHKPIAVLDFVDSEWNSINLSDLNALSGRQGGIAEAVSMLLLVFPDIQWVLYTSYQWKLKAKGTSETDQDGKEIGILNHLYQISEISKLPDILDTLDRGYNSLFDPAKLRNLIKQNIKNHSSNSGHRIAPYVPDRKQQAVSIDDEPEYAYFEAYTAYRFGYSGHAVTSFNLFEDLFKKDSKFRFKPDLVFDDLYLSFPDRSPNISLSDLEIREDDDHYPLLKATDYHILLTVGHGRGEQRKTRRYNHRYLFQQKIKEGTKYKILYKPFAGIFDLWEKSGMKRWLKKTNGLAEGFEWPPKGKSRGTLESEGGHSAPGRLLAIAEKLIERSRALLETADTVPKAIHGAMLALEARELLGNRTPTTSLEALSLKHQFEVKAECMFYGVEYNFDVKARIKDIKQEVKSISDWFNRKERKRSALNAEIGILNKLAAIYRNYGQFDEENAILDEMRKLYSRLWSSRKQVRWAIYPFRRYIEILMSSLSKFTLAILFWIVLFGSVFHILLKPSVTDTNFNYFDSLAISTSTFLGLQLPDIDFWGLGDLDDNTEKELKETLDKSSQFWFIMPAVLGFVHLGIFITHLYMIIQRRAGP